MLFLKEEKVFSLSRTVAAVPYGDITALFSEFYCYLLVAGLFREGEGVPGVHWDVPSISDPNFLIPPGSYSAGLSRFLTKGLKDRYDALIRHRDLSDKEKDVLTSFNTIFGRDKSWYGNLSGRDILSIAFARSFSNDMRAVARYVAVAFGQQDFPGAGSVPRLYLSVFGNIHLAKDDLVMLDAPTLRYGQVSNQGDNVTALWAMLSAQIATLVKDAYPGNHLGDVLSSLMFLTEHGEFEQSLPLPVFASSLYLQKLFGIDGSNPVSCSAMFYKDFLYGTTDSLVISRQLMLGYILNLMMEKMGETHLDHLFSANSFYRKLTTTTKLYGKTPTRPLILQFALEALDADTVKPDDEEGTDLSTPDTPTPNEDPEDPQTDTGGYDPSTPPPAMPMGASEVDKDTIGLVSFDKTGEGVDEDMYRRAVMALNDKLRSDDAVPVSAETKDTLDYWVNGFLYRCAIAATKDQITALNLQQYLKAVLQKG